MCLKIAHVDMVGVYVLQCARSRVLSRAWGVRRGCTWCAREAPGQRARNQEAGPNQHYSSVDWAAW